MIEKILFVALSILTGWLIASIYNRSSLDKLKRAVAELRRLNNLIQRAIENAGLAIEYDRDHQGNIKGAHIKLKSESTAHPIASDNINLKLDFLNDKSNSLSPTPVGKEESVSWFKVSLTSNQVASGEINKIQHEFDNLYHAAGRPKDMALFSATLPVSKDDFAVLYFSPVSLSVATSLISKYSGTACEAPKKGFALLAGNKSALNLLN